MEKLGKLFQYVLLAINQIIVVSYKLLNYAFQFSTWDDILKYLWDILAMF